MTREINTGITEGDLLEYLANEINKVENTRQPGDVSVQEVMQRTGRKREYVRDFLNRQIEAGVLSGHWICENGKRIRVYRRAT